MTKTKTGSPFEIMKGQVYYDDGDGMQLFNNYKNEDLPQPDSVDVEMDALTGEVSVVEYGYENPEDILQDEIEPESGQRPPTSGAPDVQVQMPDYLSQDVGGSGGNYDEDFTPYLDRMSKVYTPPRETEIEKGKFLRYKELYKSLSKGWDDNSDINRIIENTERLMKMFPDDGEFLTKCGELLCSFDYRAPKTKFVKVVVKSFSKGDLEDLVKNGTISKADMENALAFQNIRKEAQEELDSRTPATLDHEI